MTQQKELQCNHLGIGCDHPYILLLNLTVRNCMMVLEPARDDERFQKMKGDDEVNHNINA